MSGDPADSSAAAQCDSEFRPAGPLRGELAVPPDKSISHRAALFGAMAGGVTRVRGYLDSADTRSTLAAVQRLGARVRVGESPDGAVFDPGGPGPVPPVLNLSGTGLRGPLPAAVDVGNAGTLIRLLGGWLAGQAGGGGLGEARAWTLDGDSSIRTRPMGRIAEPLREMGARIECAEGDLPPIAITGSPLRGIEFDSPVASAQVKSCLLIAGLLADGPTTVSEPWLSRDHTERMLASQGARLERHGTRVTIQPAPSLGPGDFLVPGDISSAAFFMVAASILPGSEIVLRRVGTNPTRTGVIDALQRMGASIETVAEQQVGGEPVSDLRVRAAELRGTEVGGAEIPRLIDEIPILALAACFAEGTTVFRDAAELRRKESDRVETVAAALRAIGAEVETAADGLAVTGVAGARAGSPLAGGTIESSGDHRIAMLGAIAGLATRQGVTVRDMAAASVSYPAFEADLASLLNG